MALLLLLTNLMISWVSSIDRGGLALPVKSILAQYEWSWGSVFFKTVSLNSLFIGCASGCPISVMSSPLGNAFTLPKKMLLTVALSVFDMGFSVLTIMAISAKHSLFWLSVRINNILSMPSLLIKRHS